MRAVVVCDSSDLKDQVRQIVLNSGWQCSAEDLVTPRHLAGRLSQVRGDLIIVLFGANRPEALDAVARMHGAGLAVVAICNEEAEQARAAGARSVLTTARMKEDLRVVLESTGTARPDVGPHGQTIVTLGVNPGCGVTTIASGLAFALGAAQPGKVALAEIGVGVPELALDLGVAPPHSLADIVRHWERLDHSVIKQSGVEHKRGVQVLAYPEETMVQEALDPNGMRQLTVLLRSQFKWTVFDAGHQLTPAVDEAIRLAETVLLVMRLDVPSLRLARPMLRALKNIGAHGDRIQLVVNRYGQRGQLAWKKVEEQLERKVVAWIPDDSASVNYALNHGAPLVEAAGSAKITRRFAELANQLGAKK